MIQLTRKGRGIRRLERGLLKRARFRRKPPPPPEQTRVSKATRSQQRKVERCLRLPMNVGLSFKLESTLGLGWSSPYLGFLYSRLRQWVGRICCQLRGVSALAFSRYGQALKSKEARDVSVLEKGFGLGMFVSFPPPPLLLVNFDINSFLLLQNNRQLKWLMLPRSGWIKPYMKRKRKSPSAMRPRKLKLSPKRN